MLITTSRKPSQRTRTFARSLQRVLNANYTNRGKMSLRDVLIKSSQLESNRIIIISEMKGNPSRVEILNPDGDSLLSFNITISITSSSGRIKENEFRLRCEREDLKERIISILGLVAENYQKSTDSNLVWIKKGRKSGEEVVVEFYDHDGHITGPKIYVQQCSKPGCLKKNDIRKC